MTKIILFSFAFTFFSFNYVVAEQNDAPYLMNIESSPRSEKARYDFSYFLYAQKRFTEARTQLNILFGLNSNHMQARKLFRHMNEIEGLKDIDYMNRQMAVFMNEKTYEDSAKVAPAAANTTGQAVDTAAVLKEIDTTYGLSAAVRAEYKPTEEEVGFSLEAQSYFNEKVYDRAERIYKSWTLKYPESPWAQSEFLKFLVVRDRMLQAEIIFNNGKDQFSKFLRNKIIGTCIKEFKEAKSSEQKEAAKAKMQKHLFAYEKHLRGAAVPATADPVPHAAVPAPESQAAPSVTEAPRQPSAAH
ncbi:MAG: hypothetical protein AB7F59_03695 [Bdellovibrionales bacterium]